MNSYQKRIVVILVFTLALVLSGCFGGGGGVVRHVLNVEWWGQGTVTPGRGEHEYAQGTLVTVTAEPAEGWFFSHWVGDAPLVDEPTIAVVMDGARSLEAFFVPDGFTADDAFTASGQVLDLQGDPMPGVEIFINEAVGEQSRLYPQDAVPVLLTDADGLYAVSWLFGLHVLAAMAELGGVPLFFHPEEAWVDTTDPTADFVIDGNILVVSVEIKQGEGTTNPVPGIHVIQGAGDTIAVSATPAAGYFLDKIVVVVDSGEEVEYTSGAIDINVQNSRFNVVQVLVYFEPFGSNVYNITAESRDYPSGEVIDQSFSFEPYHPCGEYLEGTRLELMPYPWLNFYYWAIYFLPANGAMTYEEPDIISYDPDYSFVVSSDTKIVGYFTSSP